MKNEDKLGSGSRSDDVVTKILFLVPLPVRRGIGRLLGLSMPVGTHLYTLHLSPGEAPRKLVENTRWPAPDPVARKLCHAADTRFVLHLHYPELWPEFEAILKSTAGDWGLIVTLTPNAMAVRPAIEQAFPGAVIHPVDTRGRDVGPFFELLHRGLLDGARAVCKLHGKRSMSEGRAAVVGELWRRSAVLLLARNISRVEKVFQNSPRTGIVGPAHLLLPNERLPEKEAWGGVKQRARELLESLHITQTGLEFFAGSMFWISGDALALLRRLKLRLSDFEDEAAGTRDSLAHVGERIFIPVVRHSGLAVGLIEVDDTIEISTSRDGLVQRGSESVEQGSS